MLPTPPASPVLDGLAVLKALPLKIRNFCQEYVIDYNGKQAAIRAGYSARTAASIASQLLIKLNVQQAIQALAQRHANKLELTAERTMTEAACVGYFDPRKLFDHDGRVKKPHEWDDNTAAAISSYNWKKGEVTFHPKVAALTLCARISKIVDGDAVPPSMQGNFVVICPADASPDQWKILAATQLAVQNQSLKLISGNGHVPAHHASSNGDTE